MKFNIYSKLFGKKAILLPLLTVGLRGSTIVAKFTLSFFIAHQMGLAPLGLYGLVVATAGMLPAFTSVGLMTLIGREIVTQNLSEMTFTLRSYWSLSGALYLAILPFAVAYGIWQGNLGLILTAFAITVLEHVNNDSFVVLVNRRYPLTANFLAFLRNGMWAIFYMPLAWFFPQISNLEWLFGFWLAAVLVSFTLFFVFTRSWPWIKTFFNTPLNYQWYPAHIKRSGLFLLNDMSFNLSQSVDRYLITFFLGLELTGVYVLFNSIITALLNLVTTGTVQILTPHLIDAHHRGNQTEYKQIYRKLIIHTLSAATGIALAVAVLFPLAVPYLHRPLVQQSLPVFWILLVIFLMRAGFLLAGQGLYTSRQDKQFIFSNLELLIIALIANLALLPILGLYGAACAAALATGFVTYSRVYCLRTSHFPSWSLAGAAMKLLLTKKKKIRT